MYNGTSSSSTYTWQSQSQSRVAADADFDEDNNNNNAATSNNSALNSLNLDLNLILAPDSLITSDIAAFPSPTRSRNRATRLGATPRVDSYSRGKIPMPSKVNGSPLNGSMANTEANGDETPLLARRQNDNNDPTKRKKPFYRARPLWLVPFAITASLVRGMTLAPRVEVFTQLSCNRLHGGHHWNHTQALIELPSSSAHDRHQLHTKLYSSLDPAGPALLSSVLFSSHVSMMPYHFPIYYPNSISNSTNQFITAASDPVPTFPRQELDQDGKDSDDTEDPRRIPSARCFADPAVQAGAARLQTMMTTTMGFLSALTTGWWGHFGERHGRTRVLAIATLGLFLTDLMFILVSTPSSPFSKHGHILLLIAPVIEGLLGGWSTLQSATSAYLSDCTSPGSRAQIFSRFTGVFYVGFAVGPSIGGWLILHPFRYFSGEVKGGDKMVTTVFWVAIICSFMNLLLTLFVFPDSLGKKKRERALLEAANTKAKSRSALVAPLSSEMHIEEVVAISNVVASGSSPTGVEEVAREQAKNNSPTSSGGGGVIMRFLTPLSIFLPVVVLDPLPSGTGYRRRHDWSLTMLAIALFGFMLSTGLFQIKYLYAGHTYGWGAEQLSYYISFMGGGRAVWLLFLLPTLIGFFKPKPIIKSKAGKITFAHNNGAIINGKKPKPTRAQLGQEIKFDLILARCSLFVDLISHTLVALLPLPGVTEQTRALGLSFKQNEVLFMLATGLTGIGSGALPAVHSLALCMMQVRALNARVANEGETAVSEAEANEEEGTGALFGALAVLQAVGQMILGPMLFGIIYSGTVANFPKGIFVAAAGIIVFALFMLLLVKNPVRPVINSRRREQNPRGRSRQSKDLRGGAVGYTS